MPMYVPEVRGKKILGSETKMSKGPLLVEQGKASFTRSDYGQWHKWSKIGLADCRRKNFYEGGDKKILKAFPPKLTD